MASNSIARFSVSILVLSLSSATLLSTTSAAMYSVGDALGTPWWATKYCTYAIDDELYFNIGSESVLVVDRWHYRDCNTTNPIRELKDAHNVFELTPYGNHYFISGEADYCLAGQKMIVKAVSPFSDFVYRLRHLAVSNVSLPAPSSRLVSHHLRECVTPLESLIFMCFSYIAGPPNKPSPAPPVLCCDTLKDSLLTTRPMCLCHLMRDPFLMGYLIHADRMLALFSVCGANNLAFAVRWLKDFCGDFNKHVSGLEEADTTGGN